MTMLRMLPAFLAAASRSLSAQRGRRNQAQSLSTPKNKAEERANAQSIASTTRTLKELFGI